MANYPDTLRAMSTHFPWAWLMAHGYKGEEYRSRSTSFRGRFLLHASASTASDDVIVDCGIPRDQIVRKAILGAATIVDCYWHEEYETWAYVLEDAIAFEKPIQSVPGCQAIFWKANDWNQHHAFERAWKYLSGEKL